MNTPHFFIWIIIAQLLLLIAGCGGGGGNDNQIRGILLTGEPNTSAQDAVVAIAPVAANINDIVNEVILTRLDVVLDPQSTVGEVNTALEAIGGRIITSRPGSLFVTVEVPKQSGATALADLATELSGFPGIITVIPGREASTRLLPAFDDADPPFNELSIDHLTLAKFPAAWNAGRLLADCATNPVPLIIVDKFGSLSGFGAELVATINRELPNYMLTGSVLNNGETHGWEVAAMAAAAFSPSAYTGAMPFSDCIDLALLSVSGLTYGEQLDAIDLALQVLGPTAVVNYSLGFKDRCDGICTGLSITNGTNLDDFKQITASHERAWYALSWKYIAQSMQDSFIVVTASGDETLSETSNLYTGLKLAQFSNAISYANGASDIIASTQDGTFWGNANTPGFEEMGTDNLLFDLLAVFDEALNNGPIPKKNVITVGNGNENGLSAESDFFVDLQAHGIDRLSLSGTTLLSGSSFAAPQVAGLVAYLWALDPQLRNRPMIDTINAITKNIQILNGQSALDAYAAVLSLDQNTSSEPPNAPIREAILDVNDDGFFNQNDLTLFANLFQLETAPTPSTTLDNFTGYDRFDLNGSGFIDIISGPDRFDLDPENSTYLGAAVYGTVTLNIGTESISLDENKLSDLQILCYYAYSPLYLGDTLTRSNLLPASVCKKAASSKIAFTSNRNGTNDIYTMNADGSNQVRLTNTGFNNTSPSWSPDSSQVAFQCYGSGVDICTVNSDGTNLLNLTGTSGTRDANDFAPSWSPSDSVIVFSKFNAQINTVNANGTNQSSLTTGNTDSAPAWSPDGTQIAFTSTRDFDVSGIYVMTATGGNITNLTNSGLDKSPNWSPDGSKIAFERNGDIYVINADGTNQIKLTQTGRTGITTTWSPDGLKIAFSSRHEGNDEIYTIDADGSNIVRLTQNSTYDIDPNWSSDGLKIAFVSNRDGNSEIYVMDSDGANQIRLTQNTGLEGVPIWSP